MTTGEVFTNSNLQGTYAFSSTGWGGRVPLASIGLLTFNGKGNFTGLILQNLPGDQFDERKFEELSIQGFYTVNSNGTVTTQVVEGRKSETLLAITKADLLGKVKIAQEFSFVVRDLELVTGNLITGVATRLPEEGTFTNASLSGTYVGAVVGQGGQTPGAGFGIVTYDGSDQFSESNISNIQTSSIRDRKFVVGSDRGVYTVNPNGTGTVASGGVVFVITKAEVVGGIKRAIEYAFIVSNLVPTTGIHFTGTAKRRSD